MEDCHYHNIHTKEHLRCVIATTTLLDLHLLQVFRNNKVTPRLGSDFVDGHVWCMFYQVKHTILPVHVEDREFCDDLANSTSTREGKRAFFHDLGAAVLGAMFHGDDNPRLVRVRYEVHGTTNTLYILSPVVIDVQIGTTHLSQAFLGP